MSPVEVSSEYELLRRAICDRDDTAWTAVVSRYTRIVAAWVVQHPAHLDPAAIDCVVNRAFERFWQAVGPERFDAFPSLAALLAYLKMCAASCVLDEVRTSRRHQLLSLNQLLAANPEFGEPAALDDPEHEVASSLGAKQVWSKIERTLPNKTDRLVVYLSVEAGLSPSAICRRYPQVFGSVDALYDRKARVLARLRQHFVAEGKGGVLHGRAYSDERRSPKFSARAG